MLSKPTTQQLKSLYHLSKQPAWAEVNNVLENELKKSLDVLVDSRDDTTIRQVQGRAQFIREFLAIVQSAQAALEKSKDNGL